MPQMQYLLAVLAVFVLHEERSQQEAVRQAALLDT
jgi:hypothetical protein